MNKELKKLLEASGVGKWPQGGYYVHVTAFDWLPPKAQGYIINALSMAISLLGEEPQYNIIKVGMDDSVTFSWYPDFNESPHPALHSFVNVKVAEGRLGKVQTRPTSNPAILHRKETFVHPSHPRYNDWKAFSDAEEEAGLLSRSDIGMVKQWEAFLADRGYRIEDGVLMRRNPKTITSKRSDGVCSPEDYVGMGRTSRIGLGLPPRGLGEAYGDWAQRGIEWGFGPIVAGYVYHNVKPRGTFLDFGAGSAAMQVRALQQLGYNVIGYEWPPDPSDDSNRATLYYEAVEDGVLDPNALSYTYDYVLASNVINVQPTWPCFYETIELVQSVMRPRGTFICNLASEPREIWAKTDKAWDEVEEELQAAFRLVTRYAGIVPRGEKKKVGGSWEYYPNVKFAKDPIWECRL
jgi:hypothetical protein